LRILQLHSDFFEYTPIEKEASVAEECEKEKKQLKDVVVLFTTIEEGDNEKVAKKAIEETKKSLETLKVKKILIYPYAHLSNKLATPNRAFKLLKTMEQYAKELGIETYRSPFGWCKQFTVSIKGHPLAEQFRVITSAEVGKEEEEKEKVSEALKAEEKLKSYWYILDLNGELIPVEEFDFTNHPMLEKFAKYEISKSRAVQQAPPHTVLMRRLEIADYELGSDPGNMRWYPKGRLIKSLLEQYVTEQVIEYGAMEVETPVMYDFKHPSLAKYLDRFPARQYVLRSEDKELFLRFSACFGQFLMIHDAQISHKHLPLKLYELTRYSFRREKSGELSGLRRLRAFTMPDCHAFCADIEQAKQEALTRFKLSLKTLEDGLELTKEDYELAIRFTKDFYEQNKDFIVELVKTFGKPALVEMWEERFFYFTLKWEFNFVDNLNKASALRRDIYALLEKAYREQKKGKRPMLPLWLSPTQVRVIPVSENFLSEAEKIAEEIEKNQIRVDLDDRQLTLQKKVRDAETEWIHYIVVVGKKEVESGTLSVRDRTVGKIRQMNLKELVEEILEKTMNKPFKKLSLPKHLSKRPQFYG